VFRAAALVPSQVRLRGALLGGWQERVRAYWEGPPLLEFAVWWAHMRSSIARQAIGEVGRWEALCFR